MSNKTRYPGIFKTKHGTYEVFYRDPNRKQRSQSFKRLQDALTFQGETKRAVRRGEYQDPQKARTTFGAWAEKYLEQKANIERRTRDKYRESFKNHLLPAFGGMALADMTPDLIQEWVATMGRTYKAETVRGHYALLASILKRATARGLIAKSPCIDIELPKVVKAERRYLTEDDLQRLIDVMPDRYKVLAIVGGYLGLRWQEMAGLRRTSLDLSLGKVPSLRVTSTIERSNGTYRVKEYGKSDAARRTLKMPASVARAMAWHLGAFPDDEWVFSSPMGGYLRYDNFRTRVWLPATQAAGLAPFDLHELRHTAAAYMISEGANPLQVKRRMGHEDIRTTYNVYGHLFDDDEDALVERLDQRALRGAGEVRSLLGATMGDVVGLPTETALKAV
jgi:integrase